MAELVIRQAEERDIAAIETLEQQCFAVPWTYESLYHDVMHNKLAFYIVAEADGVLYHYPGRLVGDYDLPENGSAIRAMLLRGLEAAQESRS